MPKIKRFVPKPTSALTGPVGIVEGWDEVTEEEGGVVLARCGISGLREFVEVPAPTNSRPRPVECQVRRALAQRGWDYDPRYGWVKKAELRRIRMGISAGHVQLELCNQNGG